MDTAETNLLELGCYLYRTTPAILELQRSSNIPPNATEILQSLSSNVDLAGELVRKYSKGEKSNLENEPKNIVHKLKEVIGNIGDDLSLIPSSTFENQRYAEIAVRSLSREMKRANFHVSDGQLNDAVATKTENTTIQEGGRGESIPIPDSVEEHKRHSDDRNDPHLREFLKGMYYGVHGNNSYSLKTLPQLAEYIEPLYDTFFCPLTKKIMEDPVTIESGITYERRAITEWFDRLENDTKVITCPTTGMEIKNISLNTNIALKTTMEEWKERNEANRIKVAHTALTLAKSDAMVLDAIRDLKLLCRKRSCNNVKIHNVGITMLLTRFLKYKDTKLRCETLEILCLLAEDEEGKVCF